jgi:hypothetical protein
MVDATPVTVLENKVCVFQLSGGLSLARGNSTAPRTQKELRFFLTTDDGDFFWINGLPEAGRWRWQRFLFSHEGWRKWHGPKHIFLAANAANVANERRFAPDFLISNYLYLIRDSRVFAAKKKEDGTALQRCRRSWDRIWKSRPEFFSSPCRRVRVRQARACLREGL